MTIFADDTNILVWHQDENIAINKMNTELKRLDDWLRQK